MASCTTDADCGPGVCDVSRGYCTSMQTWNLVLDATNSAASNGTIAYASVRDAAGVEVASANTTVAGNGSFSFTWNDILADGGDFTVDVYVDVVVDVACVDADDEVFQVLVPAVTADVSATLDISTATENPTSCASF